MRVTAKSDYALRALVELAAARSDDPGACRTRAQHHYRRSRAPTDPAADASGSKPVSQTGPYDVASCGPCRPAALGQAG